MNEVDAYIETAPPERQETLTRLRDECRARLEGYEEGMEFRMPSYRRDGVVEISFANQSRYISFYVMKQGVLDAHSDRLAGLSVGKSCVRFGAADDVDWDLVGDLLDATRESDEPVG
jgi:uncharacterized protein YdhG (YjbR/CyaY superfamily)